MKRDLNVGALQQCQGNESNVYPLNQDGHEPSKKEIFPEFSWKEYFILVFASMIGVVAALPSAWNVIEKTTTLGIIPSASSRKGI